MKLVFILILLIYSRPFYVKGESFDPFFYQQISLMEGLDQTSVRSILEDHTGCYWIGTSGGINKMIGKEIFQYPLTEDDKPGHTKADITFIAEDGTGTLWVASNLGLFRYHREEDRFDKICIGNGSVNIYSYCLTEDAILFGASGSIYKFPYDTKEPEKIALKDDIFNLSQIIQRDNENFIVMNVWQGLFHLNMKTRELTPFKLNQEKGRFTKIYLDKENMLWVSIYNKGVLCLDLNRNEEIANTLSTETKLLSNDIIWDITEYQGKIYMASDGGGINIYNRQDNTLKTICNIPGDLQSFPDNSVFCLYEDRKGYFWAGTVRGGAVGIKNVAIHTYGAVPANSELGLSNHSVSALLEEDDRNIWIGTDGGGINLFNPQTGKFRHFASTLDDKITAITHYDGEHLLLTVFSKGIFLFNKKSGKMDSFTKLSPEGSTAHLNSRNVIINLCNTGNGKILILSGESYAFDPASRKFSQIKEMGDHFSERTAFSIYSNLNYSFIHDYENIYQIENITHKATVIYQKKEIKAVTKQKGLLWIADDKNIKILDLSTRSIDSIDFPFSENINSLVCDEKNRLWIGTNKSVICYHTQKRKFLHLSESDGVKSNSFLPGSTLISQNGEIYMGGATGLVRIGKEFRFGETETYPVSLLSVWLDNKLIPADQCTSRMEIPWNFSSLKLRLLIGEKDFFQAYKIRYSVTGRSTSQMEASGSEFTLSMLSPDEYEIFASYYMKDGTWSQPVSVLKIRVKSPWWKQTWFLSLLFFIGGLITILISLFVNERRKTKMTLMLKEHEQKLSEEKVNFLINISHELRTPLTLIYAPLKRMLQQPDLDSIKRKQLFEIFGHSQWMTQIINMVLDVRRMETESVGINLKKVDFKSLIEKVSNRFLTEFGIKELKLETEHDAAIGMVNTDPQRIDIVLSNLLMNALKYSEPGGIVRITTKLSDECIRVSVIDEGLGIKEEDIQNLFTYYYQKDKSKSGFGIGLTYSKSIVEMFPKGKIGAFANERKGSTFYFEIASDQLHMRDKDIKAIQLKELFNISDESYQICPENQGIQLNEYTVIVVEDDKELNRFISENLQPYFRKVYTADNGEEALKKIHKHQPDLVLSDVMMPRMNGFELCRTIKTDLNISHIPVILLTARSDKESTTIGYKQGADGYLPKPFDLDTLVHLLYNQLNSRQLIKKRFQKLSVNTPVETTISNADELFMIKLNQIILENLSNSDLDLNFLVEQMGMSRSSFCNKMKQITNTGVMEYVRQSRIRKGTDLLRTTTLSVSEIADQVGFADAQYFGKVFKQHTGKSPLNFRSETSPRTIAETNGQE